MLKCKKTINFKNIWIKWGWLLLENRSMKIEDIEVKDGISIWESVKIMLIILGFQMLVVGIVIGIFDIISGNKVNYGTAYFKNFAIIIGYMIAYMVTYKYLNKKNKYKIKLINKFDVKLALCCLCILIGYILVSDNTINLAVANLVPENWVENAFTELEQTPLAAFCLMVIIAPIFEELFMRGIILEQLSRRYKMKIAITTSALMFAVMHFNITQGVNAFLIGIIFGLVYSKTKNLTICIFLHAANNLFCYLVSYFPSIYIMNFSIIKLLLGGIILAVSLYIFKKFKNVTETNKIVES